MAAIAITVALGLVAVLIVREQMWRRLHAQLRERLADRTVHMRDEERREHVTLMMSGLAQELKSPLQGVLGNTELMLASGALQPASAADLREIQKNAAHAADIVRNLIAFSETRALTRRWLDINELVIRAADGVKGELDASNARVELMLADRLPLIYVDGRQLAKVIATLLLRPPLERDLQAPPPVSIALSTRVAAAGDRVIIELDDRSADVDEPAWSGDLAACRQIAQAHGGSLEVVRGDNAGFRFQLELPVAAAGAEPAAT